MALPRESCSNCQLLHNSRRTKCHQGHGVAQGTVSAREAHTLMPAHGAESHEVAIIDCYRFDLPSCPGVTEGLGSQAPGSTEHEKDQTGRLEK